MYIMAGIVDSAYEAVFACVDKKSCREALVKAHGEIQENFAEKPHLLSTEQIHKIGRLVGRAALTLSGDVNHDWGPLASDVGYSYIGQCYTPSMNLRDLFFKHSNDDIYRIISSQPGWRDRIAKDPCGQLKNTLAIMKGLLDTPPIDLGKPSETSEASIALAIRIAEPPVSLASFAMTKLNTWRIQESHKLARVITAAIPLLLVTVVAVIESVVYGILSLGAFALAHTESYKYNRDLLTSSWYTIRNACNYFK